MSIHPRVKQRPVARSTSPAITSGLTDAALTIAISAGQPGPDGKVRPYAVYDDAIDLLYSPDLMSAMRPAVPAEESHEPRDDEPATCRRVATLEERVEKLEANIGRLRAAVVMLARRGGGR